MANDRTCALIAALLWGPKTRAELASYVSDQPRTLDRVLKNLRHHGLVYRCGSVKPEMDIDGNHKSGVYPVLWAFNTTPFAEADRVTWNGKPICTPLNKSAKFDSGSCALRSAANDSTTPALNRRPPAPLPATSCAAVRPPA